MGGDCEVTFLLKGYERVHTPHEIIFHMPFDALVEATYDFRSS